MIKQILPVPVLASPCGYDLGAPSKLVSEARESTENCDRKGAAREIGSMADSRGGQKLSDDDELSAWLETLPRKVRFMLAMSVSALSLQRGQCRSRNDLMCFLSAAGLPVSRQAIENIECRALRKCRESELARIAKEHLTIK